MELNAHIPSGPLAEKWDNHRFSAKLVNPANRRKFKVLVVGTGLDFISQLRKRSGSGCPGDALVMGLRRRGEVLVPRGDTKLRQGDLLMLVGRTEALGRAMEKLGGSG